MRQNPPKKACIGRQTGARIIETRKTKEHDVSQIACDAIFVILITNTLFWHDQFSCTAHTSKLQLTNELSSWLPSQRGGGPLR